MAEICRAGILSVDEGQTEAVARAGHEPRQDPAPDRAAAGDAGDRAADRQRGHQHAEDHLAGRRRCSTTSCSASRPGHRQNSGASVEMLFLAAAWYLVLTRSSASASTTWSGTTRAAPAGTLPADAVAEDQANRVHLLPRHRRWPEIGWSASGMNAMVKAEGVHKSFGPVEVLKGIDLEVAPREVFCLDRPVRLRQVHLPALHQPPGEDQRRAAVRRRRTGRLPAAGRQALRAEGPRGRGPAPRHRHGLPALQPLPAHDRAGERHGGAGPGQAARARPSGPGARAAAAGPGRASATRPTATPRSSPAASSSGSPSPGRWRWSPKLMLFDEPTSALDPELVGDVLDVMRGPRRGRHDDDRRHPRDGLRPRGRRQRWSSWTTAWSSSPATRATC